METVKEKWHAESIETVLKQLHSSLHGLSWAEAEKRFKLYGSNKISIEKKYTTWQRLTNQFHNVLIYVLLIASIITASLQHWIDTGVILGAVILNALIGFIQEGKAEKAIEALKQMLALKTNVFRSGKNSRISAEKLVPGDLVLLHSGDKVPADLRLVRTNNLQIEEAILTGESLPVDKNIQRISEDAPLAERYSMAYSGTFVTYGTGVGIVIATGKETEIGRISTLLTRIPKLTTPLLRQMAIFSRWLAGVILIFSLTIFLFGIFARHYPIEEMFLAAVAIAVAAIPEGLPAIMTIILAVGVTRMAKRHAIIRRLPAVETLSSVTVICTDKTGTLTKNELTVKHIITADNHYAVTGSGYNDVGKIMVHQDEVNVNSHPDLLMLIRAGILCNDAALHKENESWSLVGNPVDGALLALGYKAQLDYRMELDVYHKRDYIPFESIHKFMASLHHDHEGHAYIFVKGAPKRILEMCTHQFQNQKQSDLDKAFWHEKINQLAQNGMRVLALCFRPTQSSHVNLLFKDVEKNLIFLGLVGIVDPLQILWVNLVTAVTLGLALAFEPAEKNIMARKPRDPHEALLSRFLLWRVGFVSLLFVCAMFGLFLFETAREVNIDLARTAVVNVLVLAEAFYLINCRKISHSVLNKEGLFGSLPVLISIGLVIFFQLSFTYLPFMQTIFETQALGFSQWGLIIVITISIFLIIELEKRLVRTFKK